MCIEKSIQGWHQMGYRPLQIAALAAQFYNRAALAKIWLVLIDLRIIQRDLSDLPIATQRKVQTILVQHELRQERARVCKQERKNLKRRTDTMRRDIERRKKLLKEMDRKIAAKRKIIAQC